LKYYPSLTENVSAIQLVWVSTDMNILSEISAVHKSHGRV